MKSLSRQTGLATVEVAIVVTLAVVTMLAVLEVGRAFFVYNALEEATRRGARMAAVCQINDAAITRVAVFSVSGGGTASPIVGGLNAGNIAVEYLDQNGVVVANPAGNFGNIEYVRVRVQGFNHQLLIPGFSTAFGTPQFQTTLPRESLGVTRNGLQPC